MGLFQRLNHERGITVVFVTHSPEIAEFTRRIVRLRDGQLEGIEDVAQQRLVAAPRIVAAALERQPLAGPAEA
jgi:putative ABC transport system ATP-binding protein